MDGLFFGKTLCTPNIWALWEDQLLIRPLRIHRDLPIAGSQGHRVETRRLQHHPMHSEVVPEGEDGGGLDVGSWSGTKENIGKTSCQLGGACVLNKKQLANASYLGKNMFEESTMEKTNCPREQKHNLRGINLMHSSGGVIKQVFTQIHLFLYSISLSPTVISNQLKRIYIYRYISLYIKYHYISYITIYYISLYIVYPTKYS